jgi:hypothetical protein
MKLQLAALIFLMTACAHPIRITPDLNALETSQVKTLAEKVVLRIEPTLKNMEVVTPGSGGDSVSYYPYRDLETGLFKVLSDHFQTVQVHGSSYDLLAVPTIVTQSSGNNIMTWMPTDFMVRINLVLKDNEGRTVWSGSGEGRALDSELPADGRLKLGELGAIAASRALANLSDKLKTFTTTAD